jgi:hypothetical protein
MFYRVLLPRGKEARWYILKDWNIHQYQRQNLKFHTVKTCRSFRGLCCLNFQILLVQEARRLLKMGTLRSSKMSVIFYRLTLHNIAEDLCHIY